MRSRWSAILLGGALLLVTTASSAQPVPPPARRHRNVAMMVTGIVLSIIGGLAVTGGTIAVTAGCPNTSCAEGGGGIIPGLILLTVGVPHIGVGVPLAVVGSLPPKPGVAMPGMPAPTWTAPPTAGAPRVVGLQWAF